MYLPQPGEPVEARPERATRVAFGLVTGAVVLGVTTLLGPAGPAAPPPPPGPPRAPAQAEQARHAAPRQALNPAVPTWIGVPAIGVSAPVTTVGLDAEGWVQAPPQQHDNLAGWYEGAPTPGARGTAVVVGHVDTASGPAVFYDLGTLAAGDVVEVIREDGTAVEFTVYEVAVFDKHRIPRRVYRDTDRAELRLLTCAGPYQDGAGYPSNVVIFAHLSGVR